MRIAHSRNPLETAIEIDDLDRRMLRLKFVIDDHEDRLGSAALRFEDGQINLDEIKKLVSWDAWSGDEFAASIDKRVELAERELRDTHVGDCTCQPCSCLKCWAESSLGINTIHGLGKHQARIIFANFAVTPPPSLLEVIAKLDNYRPVRTEAWSGFPQEDFDKWVPRWTEQARQAAEWLRDYALLRRLLHPLPDQRAKRCDPGIMRFRVLPKHLQAALEHRADALVAPAGYE